MECSLDRIHEKNFFFSFDSDSLGLKGLILYAQGKKTEAFDSVKKGIQSDIVNPMAWQCLGMLHRSEKQYLGILNSFNKRFISQHFSFPQNL